MKPSTEKVLVETSVEKASAKASALSPDDFEDAIDLARDYLSDDRDFNADFIAHDFAETLVQIGETCVVGLPCKQHGGAVHGQEAEELRAGVEQILRNTADVADDHASFVLEELRRSLIFLLDHVDARDSLSFREATDPPEETTDASA